MQLYIHRRDASATQPVLELKGFERITLAPGGRRTVRFELGPETFRLWGIDMTETVEPGRVEILAGNSSAALKSATLVIA